jgi:hypothetical protein
VGLLFWVLFVTCGKASAAHHWLDILISFGFNRALCSLWKPEAKSLAGWFVLGEGRELHVILHLL